MQRIETFVHQDQIFEFERTVYQQFQQRYQNFSDFLVNFSDLNKDLLRYKDDYNINPYNDTVDKGVYLLGIEDSRLGIFPNSSLVLKCSQGKLQGGNLRHQFYRSQELAQTFAAKLTAQEQELLQMCPVYLYMQSNAEAFFKQVLVMPRIQGKTLGEIPTGFTEEFRRTFQIPSLEEIQHRFRFGLHRLLDSQKQRQLLKIQTTYLFRYLWSKDIRILSLNQKNILAVTSSESTKVRYVIIDPVADYFAPISPLYNLTTALLCT
jgi:hypothetical protein